MLRAALILYNSMESVTFDKEFTIGMIKEFEL